MYCMCLHSKAGEISSNSNSLNRTQNPSQMETEKIYFRTDIILKYHL